MSSLLSTLNIAARALSAQQTVVQIIEHNVANANTPDYHRQQAVLKTGLPYGDIRFKSNGVGQLGTGVVVEQIKRFSLNFFDGRYRRELSAGKQWETYHNILSQIEVTLGETGNEGLTNKLDSFWAGWQLLNSDPSNLGIRTDLRDRSLALAEAFQRRAKQLQLMQADQDMTIKERVAEINKIADQLAELNREIPRVRSLDNQPNDLLDERDRLLDRLAEISGMDAYEQDNGEIVVSIYGHALVVGTKAFNLVTTPDPATNLLQIQWEDGQAFIPTMGELVGIFNARDQVIQGQLDGLNNLALVLRDQVNALHQIGYNMADPANPSGMDFFTIDDVNHAALTFRVSDDIMAGVENIAAAETANSAPGDGNMARRIADLQNTKINIGGKLTTMNDFYNNQIADLAVIVRRAEINASDRQSILRSLSAQRESVGGVNLDEEATNLMQSQKAYNAAARVLTAIDEMLDRIINNMGVVGR